jgi:hypothetical protein
MFFNLLKQLYFCSFAQHWETILPRRIASLKHASPILQYLKNAFTFFAKKLYKMSLVALMPKCKKEMEQIRESFLEESSSREGLLPSWLE